MSSRSISKIKKLLATAGEDDMYESLKARYTEDVFEKAGNQFLKNKARKVYNDKFRPLYVEYRKKGLDKADARAAAKSDLA